jgi:hypothetical protein|tara:strand:- start:37 stop:543 length:507 start_codon:yes stop_codon:yes gene_type:complete
MYAKIDNGVISEFPYTFLALRKDNPNTSFPLDALDKEAIRNEYSIVEVTKVPRPDKAGWLTIEESPSFSDGVWSQTWKSELKDVDDLQDDEIVKVEMPVQDGYLAVLKNPELIGDEWHQSWELIENTWLENRTLAYGDVDKQIEFITENGLEAWQARVAEIKARYPEV